jgi:hypothetical protein
MGSALYNGRIYLSAGSHAWFDTTYGDFKNTDLHQVLTIAAAPQSAPGSVILEAAGGKNGLKYGSLHLRGLTIISPPVEDDSEPTFPKA